MKTTKRLLLLTLFPLAAFARGDNPGNWPEPPTSERWILSVVYAAVKMGTGVAIDADTARLAFSTKKACDDFADGLRANMPGIEIKHSCQLVGAD